MPTHSVLVVGDANLDLVLHGDVVPRFGQQEQILDDAALVLGSSAGIVAAGLARLDVETSLCAYVGDDFLGARTADLLGAAGVDVDDLGIRSSPTGLSVILSRESEAGAGRAILTLPGAMSEITAEAVRGAAARRRWDHVHVAALFLLPSLGDGLPAVLSELQAGGTTVSLDTNWDPRGNWSGIEPLLHNVDVFLPNAVEVIEIAVALGDGPSSAVEAARMIASRGPLVVVKDGAAGAFAVTVDGTVVSTPSFDVDVVDTTGAGDSFDAGFLAAWLDRVPLEQCLRWGAAAGALSTRASGGTGAQATRDDIARLANFLE